MMEVAAALFFWLCLAVQLCLWAIELYFTCNSTHYWLMAQPITRHYGSKQMAFWATHITAVLRSEADLTPLLQDAWGLEVWGRQHHWDWGAWGAGYSETELGPVGIRNIVVGWDWARACGAEYIVVDTSHLRACHWAEGSSSWTL